MQWETVLAIATALGLREVLPLTINMIRGRRGEKRDDFKTITDNLRTDYEDSRQELKDTKEELRLVKREARRANRRIDWMLERIIRDCPHGATCPARVWTDSDLVDDESDVLSAKG